MQVAFYIIPIARKYKQLTSNQLNMNIEKIYKVCEQVERARGEIFAFVRSKTPISFNVELVLRNLVLMFVGYFVT